MFGMKHGLCGHMKFRMRRGGDFEGFDGHGGRDGFGGRGRHGRERMFEQGDVRLLILSLLDTSPRHGYEVIKAIGDLAGGDYTPSPGVIYPTLTMLEDLGYARVINDQGGKKQYEITPEGKAFLNAHQETLERIRARLGASDKAASARRSPELQRAIQNFRTALHLRLARDDMSPETLRRIADVMDRAAIEIERL